MNIRLLLLTRYPKLGASSRYRSYQYIPYLEQHGFEITPLPLVDEDYLRKRYIGGSTSKAQLAGAYLHRAVNLARRRNFDLLWIEKEAFPYFPAWLERLLVRGNVPYVVDYDDAVFHNYDLHSHGMVRKMLGTKIDHVMRDAQLVLAGNPYLAKRAADSGAKKVTVLPTVVDLGRYPPQFEQNPDRVLFGWIGTPFTAKYLNIFESIIPKLAVTRPIGFTAIGSGALGWTNSRVKIVPWTEDTEIQDLLTLDVGVMPLVDSPWERGKCGFKLIQYMACGLPVLASPIGVNAEIVEPGINGFLCSKEDDWIESMALLASDPVLRTRFGRQGRRKVEDQYSLQNSAPKLAQALREASDQT